MSGLFGQLLPLHRVAICMKSGVAEDVAEERGYRSVQTGRELLDLGYSATQLSSGQVQLPGWVAPLYRPDGTVGGWTFRADVPPSSKHKYINPKGGRSVLDVHPRSRAFVGDPSVDLWVLEGVKKLDALVSGGRHGVSLSGVWNWRGTNARGGKVALSDWEDVALNGRTIVLCFDTDSKPTTAADVRRAKMRLTAYLESKGAKVKWCELPPDPGGQKVGVDDYLLTHTMDELEACVVDPPTPPAVPRPGYDDYRLMLEFLGYGFRLNEATAGVELNGEHFDDPTRASILFEMGDRGYSNHTIVDTVVLHVANLGRYHPVKEYLEEQIWDGFDWIAKLATYFKDKHGVFGKYLRKWLVGAVARVFEETQNRMLVVVGPQQSGKSTFPKWLCSPLPSFFEESPVDPSNKDYLVKLMKTWVWEVGELGATTRKADREALKHFLTRQTVQVRPAYARNDVRQAAMASFIGTVNDEGTGFLNDTTGYRRYMVAVVNQIDWAYSAQVNVNQVWAQAMALYRGGEGWNLGDIDYVQAEELSREFEVESPLEEWLDDVVVEGETEGKLYDFLPTARIIEALREAGLVSKNQHDNLLAQDISRILTARGYKKVIRDSNGEDKDGGTEPLEAAGRRKRGWVGLALKNGRKTQGSGNTGVLGFES